MVIATMTMGFTFSRPLIMARAGKRFVTEFRSRREACTLFGSIPGIRTCCLPGWNSGNGFPGIAERTGRRCRVIFRLCRWATCSYHFQHQNEAVERRAEVLYRQESRLWRHSELLLEGCRAARAAENGGKGR